MREAYNKTAAEEDAWKQGSHAYAQKRFHERVKFIASADYQEISFPHPLTLGRHPLF
jgi:hypothetical protein